MKCSELLIVAYIIRSGLSQQQLDSLSAMSLLAPQLEFLEGMCLNRTENVTVFEELTSTFEDCQTMVLNGTEMTLTYNTLVQTDPIEFYKFYTS